ncbi:MAG: D-glycero-beta-D-manno-heptose 1-phosphate adenylyltransferase [Putridiphycobacter sp.]|nr:D-glycero-beta-D-manno-heptose 1-phosphate adenylyltransferase [Putridiphycobacter sp.]
MKTLTQLKHKILLNESEAAFIVSERQKEGKKVVFTNGCFDILHKGHVEYLAQAADCGDVLMVAVNTDASVKAQNKGEERPINKELDRLELLAALFFVDYVVLFNDDTPQNLIEQVTPNVLVKGADYNPNQLDKNAKDYIVGRDIVIKNGGEVKAISLLEGYSTTSIVNKLKN